MVESNLNQDRIIKVNIEDEMRTSYINYSMSVIVARALPDVRDGFKPVHRRVLYGMNQIGNWSNKPTLKSARIVGEVLGKYHPHGDSSVYGALARMAQEWNLRYPQVDGQGNFGSIDGDSPAAMRYTEARLSKISEEMLRDIEKDTVDMQDNFDGSLKEPTVLPTRIPTLLVNGANGIAVGMATNMPPHNLSECVDGICAYIDNPDITIEELMQYIKAPDFPTGGIIYGYAGVKDAYETGRGRIVIRAKAEIETEGQRDRIIISEIPYGINKSELIKHIATLVDEKKLEGIANVNDESDRHGMRIVVDLKKDVNANVVLNKLYKMTECQSAFSVNNIALVGPTNQQRPQLLNLKEIIYHFVNHRHEVVVRRTKFDLAEAEKKAHILEGLIIACDNIEEVIRIIRASKTPQDAITGLTSTFELDEIQARAIVEMRLRQLTGLLLDELHANYEELEKQIAYYKEILADEKLCMQVVKDELIKVKETYGDERRTEIVYSSEEFNPEDFYADDEMVITISHMGYIKRTPLAEFRAQNRGGVGSKGSNTRDEDFIEYMYSASMHNTLLFFTQKGRCYWAKVYELPEGNKTSKGRAIQNMLNIEADDKVTAFIKVKTLTDQEYNNSHYIVFATRNGLVKKTSLANYARRRANGINAITIREGDQVVEVALTDGKQHLILANRGGRAICFPETRVRTMGRMAAGVRGLRLDEGDDAVVGMITVEYPGIDLSAEAKAQLMQNEYAADDAKKAEASDSLFSDNDFEEENAIEDEAVEEEVITDAEEDTVSEAGEHSILVVSENGFGKRSSIASYRITNRGGKGVKTLQLTDKTGPLVAIKSVTDTDDLMIINKSGIVIRLHLAGLRLMGRATQGVKLIDLTKKNDRIASVCKVVSEEEENKVAEEAAENPAATPAEGQAPEGQNTEE
jgi:DNA gyrase subunit A